ncbi:lactococcin 972 family bacteriocin [Cellulosimicrobium cellulans]|jgi:lactococcin 972 family bacteriocin|uniref:Lactococcin 972 family bacteriocin n=1 Tax=Cellulosimicrobium cellulans TaxID=1710 RepID=A0A4Y4E4N6_CELCE|nr:lactococcin 972 family bacteriocin [Cellulosimicrobium cellulans]GED10490.1 hypothetical protein CCE02nite_24890 [Cellulosimicrobium cellulans]
MTFRRVLTTAMVAGMVALTPAVAFAGSKVVGGGVWNYGTSGGIVYSHYHHNTACHGASVDNGKLYRVTNIRGGVWAKVGATDWPMHVDHAYWHQCG